MSAQDTAASPSRIPIGGHRLLSSGRSLALLTPAAAVDWWCGPDFDSNPLLWSLLDPRGGSSRWQGATMIWADGPPAGPVLETTIRVGRVRLRCRDGLVHTDGGAALVRLVRTEEGTFPISHELPLPHATPWPARGDDPGPLLVRLLQGDPLPRTDGVILEARDDAWAGIVIAPAAATAPATGWEAALAHAEAGAAEALRDTYMPRHHPERAADALAVLRACTYAPTGALAAAATTSLPEAPGGDRQFDYRFCWLRDAGLAASVASLLGQPHAAERYLAFVHDIIDPNDLSTSVLADVRGGPVPTEQEVDGIRGWADSRPIRVGNGAAGQLQYDALGIVIEAVSVHVQTGGRLTARTWDLVRAVADVVAERPAEPSSGIWEFREPRLLVGGEIGRWLVLDRALWIARGWRPFTRRRQWKKARDASRRRVLDAIDDRGRLPQAFDDDRPDASGLMAVLFGMLHPRDARAARIVDTTIADLESGDFLYRYVPDDSDGFSGREGAFLPVCWWAVAALAAVGRIEEAEERLDALCRQLPRLLSEEVDPESGALLGNVPLLWSHMELARALYLLDAAKIRARWTRPGLVVWRGVRYLRMRSRARRGPS